MWIDFPKRYFDEWKYDINVIKKILKTIIQKNIVLEVNTSTLNGEGTQPMPSVSVLELYLKLGGTKVVLSSDAHVTKFLGKSFDEALKIIPKDLKVGYFKNRKFIEIERNKYQNIEENNK